MVNKNAADHMYQHSRTVLSVATRNDPGSETPAPPPMVTPSMIATYTINQEVDNFQFPNKIYNELNMTNNLKRARISYFNRKIHKMQMNHMESISCTIREGKIQL